MQKLSSKEETRLIKAVEEAVYETRSGLSPDDAIQKVAQKHDYTPPFIDVIVGAFNKSKAVHNLTNGSGEFELASTPNVVNGIYGEKTEKVACQVPKGKFSEVAVMEDEQVLQKVAADSSFVKYASMTKSSIFGLLQKAATVQNAVGAKLHSNLGSSRIGFDKAVSTAVDTMRPMMKHELQKVAQALVNGYPRTGSKFVALLSSKLGKDLPKLEKTAYAAVFPLQEPYVSIATAYEKASDIAQAENALRAFKKEAKDTFMQEFLANVAADAVGMGGAVRSEFMEDPKELEDQLSPEFYNKLKSVDTRKNFMNLALYDKDLQKFNFNDLIDSFNAVSQVVPAASTKPIILRNLMLRNLETGGLKDPFELTSELGIGKLLSETDKNKTVVDASKKAKMFRPVEKDPTAMIPKTDSGASKDKSSFLGELLNKSVEPSKKDGKKSNDADVTKRNAEFQSDIIKDAVKKNMGVINRAGFSIREAEKILDYAEQGRLQEVADSGEIKDPKTNEPYTKEELTKITNDIFSSKG